MTKTDPEKKQLIQKLKTAEENHAWLQTHGQELLKSYQDQWVAVHKGHVAASDTDRARLFEKLRRDHPDFQLYAVELITSTPLDLIRRTDDQDPLSVLVGKRWYPRHIPVEELEEMSENR